MNVPFSVSEYLANPDKYVFPFIIKEKDKERTIITYNKGQYGCSLRKHHEQLLNWFNENIADRNEYSFAYHKGVRCSDALREHLKSNFFIKLDIHKFFESITEDLFFEIYGDYFNKKTTTAIKSCFYKGALSIGFVTSPMISDYFMRGFDKAIGNYVKDHPETHYSRYSDDILLSSEETDDDSSLNALFELVKKELAVLKLEVNPNKLFKTKLSYQEHNSLSFLGLGISKLDDIDNKVTISKRYILFLLSLIKKNKIYGSKCKGLLDEINSRVAYLAYNSPISYMRFQKKHLNMFGEEYKFTPRVALDRVYSISSDELPNYKEYAQVFEFELHDKISNTQKYGFTKLDAITIKKYIGKDDVVIIPKFVDAIGKSAFNYSRVKEVIFEGNIKQIGERAFEGCARLNKISFPDSLRYIGRNAFADCLSLKEIVIPSKIKAIEPLTFNKCGLERVDLPDTLKEIRLGAFSGTKLKEFVAPASLEVLGVQAFYTCKDLRNISLNEGLLKIDDRAFACCHKLVDVKLPKSLLEIESGAFKECVRLENIKIPANVVSIKNDVFNNCTLLNNIEVDKDNRVFAFNKSGDLIEKATNAVILFNGERIDPSLKVIPDNAFKGKAITKIVIPEGIEEIGTDAFANCCTLKQVKLPESLKEIKEGALRSCLSLKSIVIPSGVKVIPNNAFANCDNLTKVVLPEGLIKIGENAFENDKLLKDINIPHSVTSIEKHAFKYCYAIEDLYLSENIKKIHKKAFYGCSYSLNSIKINPLNVTFTSGENANIIVIRKTGELILGCKNSYISRDVSTIYNHAFVNCVGLKKIVLSKSTTIIQAGAFEGCLNLEKVNLGNVYTIGKNAFKGDEKITEIILPESLTKIEEGAFLNTNIKSLKIPASLGNYELSNKTFNLETIEELHISAAMKKLVPNDNLYLPSLKHVSVDKSNDKLFDNGQNLVKEIVLLPNNKVDKIILGSSTATFEEKGHIEPKAFKGIKGLKKLHIPSSIMSIGESAFEGCPDLKEVTITIDSDLPYFLDKRVFANCEKLEKVVIESKKNKAVTIKEEAFEGCKSLKNVVLPKTLERIENGTFKHCSSLKNIDLPENVSYIGQNAFLGCEKLESIRIPKKITVIYPATFNDCRNLKEVILPDTITSIGAGAFKNCFSLEEIALPKSLKEMTAAFNGCESLKKVIFNKKLEVVGDSAFEKCKSLKSLVLPEKVKKIGNRAFANCESLESIHVNPKLKEIGNNVFDNCKSLKGFDVPQGIGNIGSALFAGCSSLKEIVVPEKVKLIGMNAFRDSGLSKIAIPSSVTQIETSAFANCVKLVSVVFEKDSKLERIGDTSFYQCTSLKEIALPNKLKEIGDHSFAGCLNLKEVKLPESLEVIKRGAFAYDNKLKEVYVSRNLRTFDNSAYYCCNINKISVSEANKYFEAIDNALVIKKDKKTNAPSLLFAACKCKAIPEKVTTILPYAFASENKLEELVIPEKVTTIFNDAFSGLANLKSLTIKGNNLKSIGNGAFKNSPLISLNIPDSVETIGSCAFAKYQIKELNLSKNVSSFSSLAFDNSKLKKISVDKDNNVYASLNKSVLLEKENKNAMIICSNAKIEEGVEELNGFIEGQTINELNIPCSINAISELALNEVNIKKFVVNNNPYFETNKDGNYLIDKNNRELLYYQNDAILPDHISGLSGFFKMKGKKLYIPKTFIDIRSVVMNPGIRDIEEIEVDKDNPFFDSRDNCNAIINKKTNTLLLGCKNSVIPESVSVIGNMAFFNSGIKNIYIPKHIRYIALEAFDTSAKYDSIEVEKGNPFFEAKDNRTIIINKNYDKHGGSNLIKFKLSSDKDEKKQPQSYTIYIGYEYDGSIEKPSDKGGSTKGRFSLEDYQRVVNKARSSNATIADDDMPF